MKSILERFIKICPKSGNFKGFKKISGLAKLLFPLIGIAAIIWILLRVIPKPSRAEYPCMKVAAPLAGGFLVYISGLLLSVFSFRQARHYFRNSQYALTLVLIVSGFTAGLFIFLNTNTESFANPTTISRQPVFVPTDAANTPMGTARGIFPGRVVWKWDPSAAKWNGTSGNWWTDANTNPLVVDTMLSQSLRALTGKPTNAAAWDTLFRYFNAQHGKGNTGYQAGEKIAIKINLVQSSAPYGGTGNQCFVPPQLAFALLRQLVDIAGVKDSCITIYDTDRYVPDPVYTKCKSAYPGVHFMGWDALNGREKYMRDTTRVHWSENLTQEINGGNPAYLPTVVTQASYLINLADFKGHRYMGVTFCSKNHFGTLSCDMNGSPYQNAPHAAGLHYYTAVHDIFISGSPEWTFNGRPMGTYNTLVDLMGHRDLGAKTLLFMVDALYAVQDEGAVVSPNSKWLSAPFNNGWTSSLFLSQDNVAIESVCLDFIRTEAAINKNDTTVYGAVDNYLHEAAQADNPPSGTVYRPSGNGPQLQSLGVHEHWNNPIEKNYSKNLGTGNGIELVSPQTSTTAVTIGHNIPSDFALRQNYPNPFNPSTTITYDLSVRGSVSLKIYDALGRDIATLVNKEQAAGTYEVPFYARNLTSGVYFYRLQIRQTSGIYVETKKLVLLR
jgi:hypothetical protein